MNYYDKSKQITGGLRKSFQQGNCKMANRICYGYDIILNGKLVINKDEAIVVQNIFKQYLAGDSLSKIVTAFEKQSILSPTGKAKWNREAISKLLSNEKYTGSVLLQKTISLEGMQFQNEGELDRFLIKGHHEAIITATDFEKVQEMKIERSKSPLQVFGIEMSY